MSVNFFMILSPAVLSELPQTFIAAFYVPKQNAEPLEAGLLGRFPSLTVIDLETILNQVRRILTQVVTAVQALFGFSLVAGALVLWAALVATRDERMKEAVLLRALGASKGQLIRAQVFELLAVGGIAGLASAVLAQLIGWVVADQVFQLPVAFNFMAMLGGLGLGAIICLLAGMWALRPVFQRSPVEALRSRA
jgi:putative ABC transport system permease protein